MGLSRQTWEGHYSKHQNFRRSVAPTPSGQNFGWADPLRSRRKRRHSAADRLLNASPATANSAVRRHRNAPVVYNGRLSGGLSMSRRIALVLSLVLCVPALAQNRGGAQTQQAVPAAQAASQNAETAAREVA